MRDTQVSTTVSHMSARFMKLRSDGEVLHRAARISATVSFPNYAVVGYGSGVGLAPNAAKFYMAIPDTESSQMRLFTSHGTGPTILYIF